MKVKLKKDYYDLKAGVVYEAEPVFNTYPVPMEMVKIKIPCTVVCVYFPWDMVEVVA